MTAEQVISSLGASSPFAVFRSRNFSLLWCGQFVSTIGDALTTLAASIVVFRLTGSALSVGLLLMASAVPTLLIGLAAGVVADRHNRKHIMMVTALLRAILVFLIPVLIPHSILWLYVIVALSVGVGQQFYDPAYESVLPETTTDAQLSAAGALMAVASFGATAIGFITAGLLATQAPIEWAFVLDGLSFLIAAACIAGVRVAPLSVQGKTNLIVVLTNLRAGAVFLLKQNVLRSVFITGIFYIFTLGLWGALLLPFSVRTLNASEFVYGLMEGLTAVGFIMGSLLMVRLSDRLREGQWVVISLFGMAGVGMLYSVTFSIPAAIFLVIMSGFLNAPYGIARRLIVQRHTPREMRGRVNSTFFVTRDLLVVIAMLVAGLADVVNVRLLVFISSALVIIPGVMALVMPGLGQPAVEWRRALSLLHGADTAPNLRIVHSAAPSDFHRLTRCLPEAAAISATSRINLIRQARVSESPPGTAIIRVGEESDAAYFILEGRAVAGIEADGHNRVLEVLAAGDFFGEIAALTGARRTANVITEETTLLFEVPADALQTLVNDRAFGMLIRAKMAERMNRLTYADMPRLSGNHQTAMRDLRTQTEEMQ